MGLDDLREEIDSMEDEIAELVENRMLLVEEIGAVKERQDISTVDESREETVKSNMEQRFQRRGMDAKQGRKLAEVLIEMGRSVQR